MDEHSELRLPVTLPEGISALVVAAEAASTPLAETVACVVALSPVTDLTLSGASYADARRR